MKNTMTLLEKIEAYLALHNEMISLHTMARELAALMEPEAGALRKELDAYRGYYDAVEGPYDQTQFLRVRRAREGIDALSYPDTPKEAGR